VPGRPQGASGRQSGAQDGAPKLPHDQCGLPATRRLRVAAAPDARRRGGRGRGRAAGHRGRRRWRRGVRVRAAAAVAAGVPGGGEHGGAAPRRSAGGRRRGGGEWAGGGRARQPHRARLLGGGRGALLALRLREDHAARAAAESCQVSRLFL